MKSQRQRRVRHHFAILHSRIGFDHPNKPIRYTRESTSSFLGSPHLPHHHHPHEARGSHSAPMGRRASDDSNKAVEYVMSGALPSEALEKYVVTLPSPPRGLLCSRRGPSPLFPQVFYANMNRGGGAIHVQFRAPPSKPTHPTPQRRGVPCLLPGFPAAGTQRQVRSATFRNV